MSVFARTYRVRFPDGAVVRARCGVSASRSPLPHQGPGRAQRSGESPRRGPADTHGVCQRFQRPGIKEDLILAFGTRDQTEVCKAISSKGEL